MPPCAALRSFRPNWGLGLSDVLPADRYLSLDPTYTDGPAIPLLRITFEVTKRTRWAAYTAAKIEEIVRAMKRISKRPR